MYPSFDLTRVNTLELAMLDALKYVIRVPASEYAKYYFHLRSMMVKLGVAKDDPNFIKPLDIEGARRLQLSTERFHEAHGADNNAANNDNNHSNHASDDDDNNNNNNNNAVVGRRRHMSLHEGLSSLQRGVSDKSELQHHHHAAASVSIEQIIHSEHMDADGGVHTGAQSLKKKTSQHGLMSPTRK